MIGTIVPPLSPTSLRRRAALVARLAETWIHRPPSPTRAVFDLTRRCNLRCRMCRTWEVPAGHELSPGELGALVRAMPRLCWLDLTGGEPTLRADFPQVLAAIGDAGRALHMLHFQTNGWLKARAVAAARVWRRIRPEVDLVVTVSIDGLPAVHDRMRGRTGAYARAIETLRALRDISGVDVHVGTTLTTDNVDTVEVLGEQLARDVAGFDVQRWHVNVAHASEHFFANTAGFASLRVDAADVVHRHRVRRGLPRDLVALMEQIYLVNLAAVQAGASSGIRCQALRSTVFVSPEGDVYPCHLYDRPLGNVRVEAFADIWASAAVAQARRDVEALRCGGCFSACEAYPALAGAPLRAIGLTLRRLLDPPRPVRRRSPSEAGSSPAPGRPRSRLPVIAG